MNYILKCFSLYFSPALLLFFVVCIVSGKKYQSENINESHYWLTIITDDFGTIQMNGFNAENHTVQTNDGYLIQIFRIVNPNRRNGYPIVLFNGLSQESHAYMSNTDGWFNRSNGIYKEYENQFRNQIEINCPPMRMPEKIGRSLPFTLASCGFDVWLANVRDDRTHSSHLFLNQSDPSYWNITMDHYTVDAETILNYVLHISPSNNVGVLCYSISCSSIYQLMSEHEQFNQLIRPLFTLSPFIFIHNIVSLPLLLCPPLEPILRNILGSSPDFTSYLPFLADQVEHNPFLRLFYIIGLYVLSGINPNEFVPERLYRVAAHFPSTAAIRILAHVGQRYLTDKLYKYDYGQQQNLRIYGTATPPYYDLSKITNPNMVLIHGTEDFIADLTDIQILQQTLNVPFLHRFQFDCGHLDFVYGRNLNLTVVRPILSILNDLNLNYN